ncbi:ABC transporter permease subunit [Lignipirellula cremea]|uniref:Ribose transport system permease protein RbsC n=1 Tax=Lignipirellula cremea TaxID=2528010 RepID=A0A518DUV4_9BACT|nr:ABC transporter permease [Lignipirellula cremea]QDU95621.1 Ribose transport system permease protein RbsC [Lignipirellula cremea]
MATAPTPPAASTGLRLLRHAWRLLRPILALLCVYAFFAATDYLFSDNTFASGKNLKTLLVDNSIIAVAALGMTLVIISGGIDLSAGTAIALCATTLAWGLHEDVAFLTQHGSNFVRASTAWRDAAQELDTAQARLRAAAKRLESAPSDRRQAERDRWQAAEERLLAPAAASKERLIQILKAKLAAVKEHADPGKMAAGEKTEPGSWEDRQRLIEQKLAGLEQPDFRPGDDPQWNEGIPNAAASTLVAVLLAVLAGVGVGLLNGVLIAGLKLAPFIVTLGTMTLYVGLGNLLSANQPIRPSAEQRPAGLMDLLSFRPDSLFLGLPAGVWLLFLLAILVALLLRYTVFGRYIFALGSNESTARLCGVNVPGYKIGIYALSGLFLGLAGVYLFSYTEVGNPMDGLGKELQIIAAVVIGGGSLNGGRGSVIGTLAGVGIMAVIDSGCDQLGLQDQAERILLGVVIIGAATIDRLRTRGQE